MIRLKADQRGGTMVLVLIVLLVLSVLGATFMTIAIAETQQVSRQKKAMQAYYLARSGADATAEDIINNSNDTFRNSLEGNPDVKISSTGNLLAQGTFDVGVTFQDNSNSIVIDATGVVPDPPRSPVSATARLRLHNLQSRAITAVNAFDLGSLSVLQGDVESTSGTIYGNPRHNWHPPNNKLENTRRDLPAVTPPSLPNYNSGAASPAPPHSFVVPNNQTLPIPGSFTYQDIIVNNNGVLVFNTVYNDIQIVVRGVLDVKGGFEIIGNNRVHIILDTPDTITNEIKTSDHNNNASNQLFIFLADGVNLQIKTGARDFFGHIYAPQGYVTLGSNAVVRGSVTGNIFSAFGNPSVFHIPLNFTPPGFTDYIEGESRYWRGTWE